MKAMIFAAGLGTRLQPLTNDRPKALVEVHGKTLLQHCIEHLKKYGVTSVVVNIHHFGERILEVLKEHDNFGCEVIISDERDALLETGGGLKKAASHFAGEDAVVIYNVDVLSNIDLNKMLDYHIKHQGLATLATRQRASSRYFLFDNNLELCGWRNSKTGEVKMSKAVVSIQELAFSGIHIINPRLLDLITQEGKFSITDSYLELAASQKIVAYVHNADYWFDVGKLELLEEAKLFLSDFC